MKKILTLCINFLLLIISDAVPVKLIAGDRSVVKKDGATHTISKYYVVPNDFDPNNVTNSTEVSETTLHVNHSIYSTSMDSDTASELTQTTVSESKAEAANNHTNENNAGVNNDEVNSSSRRTDVQVDVATQADDKTAETTETVNTQQSLGTDELGNLKVEPITSSININSSVTINEVNPYNSSEILHNGTSLVVENTTQIFEGVFADELDDLILTKFSSAVQESFVQNLESFWKLIKLNKDKISDDDEFLAKIEKLSLLLNVFTKLHEAEQWQKPVEPMIDGIIDILQKPFVENSNVNESQSQTDVSGDYDEECLRKCALERSIPQLDSNGTYLSETESLETSDKLEVKSLDLQRRHRGESDEAGDSVNTSNDPGSKQVIVSYQPTNIPRSQLVSVSDGYSVRSSKLTPTLNNIAHENKVQEDPKPNQINLDSAIIDKSLNYQSLTTKSRITDLPWHIEDKTTDHLPWQIEDKATNHQPLIIAHRTANILPWTIEDRGRKNVPWKIVNRADPNWIIENKIGHSPVTLYESREPSVITHDGNILSHPNQPITSKVHRVKHGGKQPYHVYTFVINPSTSLYKTPNSGNIVQLESRQPNANFKTKSYGLSTSQDGKEIVYTKDLSPSYYESQLILSKSNDDTSNQTSDSLLKDSNVATSDVDPDIEYKEPNPNISLNLIQKTNLHPVSKSSFYSEHTNSPDEYDELVYGGQTHQHPTLISSSSSSNSEYINLPDDYDELSPVYGEHIDKHPGLISTSSSSSAYTNLLNEYQEPVNIVQTHQHPTLISSSASSNSEYINLPDDYDEPSPVYGEHIDKHPGLISTSSSSSAYTNLLNEYEEPVNVVQPHQHPTLISSSASSNSELINLPDDYDEPSPVYGEHIDKHPGLISASSSSSTYAKLNEYEDPLNVVQTHQHPGLISSSSSSNSEYTNLLDDYNKQSLVYGEHIEKHPGLISPNSAYKKLFNEYEEPVNVVQTHQHPTMISSSASSNSEYINLPDDYEEPSPVYGEDIDKHPGLISTSSSSSAYTNLPDEYDEPVNVIQAHQHADLISSSASSNSEYTNLPDEYHELPVDDGQTHQHPTLISSSASSNSDYTNLPDDYDQPSPVNGEQIDKHPDLISASSSSPAYTNLLNEYEEPVNVVQTHQHPRWISSNSEYKNIVNEYAEVNPVYVGQSNKHPSFIFKASSDPEYTVQSNDYNHPTPDYEEDADKYPTHIQTPVNGRPTDIEDNLLVSYHPHRQTVHIIQPNLIAHLHGNQPTGHHYLKHLKLKLAPTYRLFTLDNLLKLHDVVIKTIEVNGDEPDVSDNKALMNLKKIINIVLILAEHLEEPDGSIEWYEKIFSNTQKNPHPLEMYGYNLIRQRWLHELMLLLYNNEFNFNTLQNPRTFSFLETWQFPKYVLNYMETEELLQRNFNSPEVFDKIISSQYGLQDKFATHTYDDVLEEVPESLENYVTKNVIDSYKTPHAGIVVSIAGVEAEPDANAIIHILKKYLHNKSFIEEQENIIIRDNKVEMLRQIILFLREKGYDANTIADLVRKLYAAVYSTEGKGCHTHHKNFTKNMYDVILPVLRRSGR